MYTFSFVKIFFKCFIYIILDSKDKDYIAVYEGDSFKRDMSYHQGISWPWLLGLYNDALKNIINSEKNKEEKNKYINKYLKFKDDGFNTGYVNEIENN